MEKQTSDQAGRKAGLRAAIAIAVFVAVALMLWFSDGYQRYLWMKALHIIAIISWMAGLVYLPRLFVYHTDADIGSAQSETFKVMERRLMKVIMTPAMLISWVLGLWLAWASNAFVEPWFWLKFLAVVLLSANHMFMAKALKEFAADKNVRSAKQWRMLNEIPTVLMIVIVVAVVVKPF